MGLGLYEVAAGSLAGLDWSPWALRARRRGGTRALEQASAEVSLGLGSLVALRRRSWRAPILALGGLSWLLRALARPAAVGCYRRSGLGRVPPAVGAGALAWLFSRAARAERWEAGA